MNLSIYIRMANYGKDVRGEQRKVLEHLYFVQVLYILGLLTGILRKKYMKKCTNTLLKALKKHTNSDGYCKESETEMLARIENGQIVWYSLFKKKSLPIAEIEWAYLQQEDVNAKMCCGTANFPIGRLIVVKKDQSKEVFQYEGMDKPKQLLEELHQANKEIAIGYTAENRKRFQNA